MKKERKERRVKLSLFSWIKNEKREKISLKYVPIFYSYFF